LERAALIARIEADAVSEGELEMLAEFGRAAPLILNGLPDDQEWIDWLSLMQHHGAPTRLLDFTTSFYVAAFFAATEARDEFSVWAIKRYPLDVYAHGLFSDDCMDVKYPPDSVAASYLFDERVLRASNEALMNPRPDKHYGVVLLDPQRAHERLYIQQGCFLCPLTLSAPFESALIRTLGVPSDYLQQIDPGSPTLMEDESILRIDFCSDLRLEVLKDLWRMNIRASTLFLGVDGLARSMRHYIDTASYDPVATRRVFRRWFRRI